LKNCKWPGRNQIIESENKLCKYYIDGAHTVESMEQFVEWFIETKSSEKNDDEINVLLFNYTGERDPSKFLRTLMRIDFDAVAFSKLEAYPKNLIDHNSGNF
jgi:folylpolyglutamate synthase